MTLPRDAQCCSVCGAGEGEPCRGNCERRSATNDEPDEWGDVCPVCGLIVADDEEWSTVETEGGRLIAHLFCAEKK